MDQYQLQKLVEEAQQQTHESIAMVNCKCLDLHLLLQLKAPLYIFFYDELGERDSQSEAAD